MKEENQIQFWAHMLDEAMSDKTLLFEDKESKNMRKARKWIEANHPEVIGQRLQNGVIITPQKLTEEIRNTIPNVRLCDCKFLLGTTRLYFENQNAQEIQSIFNKLNKILKILCTAHADEYDENFNGLSFEELDRKFSGAVQKELDLDKEEIGKLQLLKRSDYEIVSIDSFAEAKKYGKYTSWCVTHYYDMYDSYTKNGLGRFYFCLKPGFENVRKIKSEGCPMDEYGKSMIAISVNDDGSLNTCTCRWNHENGGNDDLMDTKQISEFFGLNFYETFKPYSARELIKKYESIRLEDDKISFQLGGMKYKDPETFEILYVRIKDNQIEKYSLYLNKLIRQSDKKIFDLKGEEMNTSLYSGNPDDYEIGDMFNVRFQGKELPWQVIGKENGLLTVLPMYVLEKRAFDNKTNKWRDSEIRQYLNSEFLKNFDPEFLKHVVEKDVHTEDYVTKDKFWLLSHEEVNSGSDTKYLFPNKTCKPFEVFSGNDSRKRIDLENAPCFWWLRSAYSSYNNFVSRFVSRVDYDGNTSHSSASNDSGVFSACTIR